MQRVSIIKELEEIKARIESIIETLEVMNDEELAQSIKKGLEEADRGELKDFDEFSKIWRSQNSKKLSNI
ncbi:MAG: hypothetical protein QXD49_05810 [Archaeoglobaceae archaeon]